jgi:hypothetical protein
MSPEGIGPDQEKRIESKRVPSGQPRDRSRPSRLKPARSASRTARVAKPRPRADARRKYDASAI